MFKPSFPLSIILLSAAISLTGCGENRAVTGSDPAAPGSSSGESVQGASSAVDPTASQASAAKAADSGVGPVGSESPAAIAGQNGNDGKNGENGSATADATATADAGKDGNNGKDGQGTTATADAIAGRDGVDGVDGNNGNNGQNGKHANNGHNGNNGNNGNRGSNGVHGVNGLDANDGIDGVNGVNGVDGVDGISPPAPELVVVNGKDGSDGKDGKDGRDACVSIVQNPPKFEAQALTPVALASYKKNGFKDLPYLSSTPSVVAFNKEKGKHVGVSITTIFTGSTAKSAPKKMLTDTMTLFDVEVKLPARSAILKTVPFKTTLHLSLHKKSVDRTDDTEMLCILDTSTCSGAPFHKNMIWGDLLNPKFGDRAFINKVFSDNLAAAMSLSTSREFAQPIDFDLAELLAPAGQRLTDEEILDFLYGKDNFDKPLVRTIRLLVADDTQVVNTPTEQTYLEVSYGYNGCQIEDAEKAGK